MNILLTGSTGFVGSHVARRLLAKGHTVRAHYLSGDALSRISDIQDDLDLVEGGLFDSTDSELKKLCAGMEACIHCAWYAVPGKYLEAPENLDCLQGSVRLFSELAQAGCKRCVGIGTCFEYDTNRGYLAEDTPTKATTLYAAAKTSAFLLGEQLSKSHNMSFAWARLFYIHGPYEDPRRLVPYVINSLLQGTTADVSSGVQVLDYMHIEDVASAIVAVVERSLTGPVNIGSALPVKVSDIVKLIGTIMGRPELLNIGASKAAPTDPPFICANNTKLQSHTDWKPRYDTEQSLRATVAWWKDHYVTNEKE